MSESEEFYQLLCLCGTFLYYNTKLGYNFLKWKCNHCGNSGSINPKKLPIYIHKNGKMVKRSDD